MKIAKEEIKNLCINYLLVQAKDSKTLKEQLTVIKYEQFQEWIKNLDYDTITRLVSLDEKSSSSVKPGFRKRFEKEFGCIRKCAMYAGNTSSYAICYSNCLRDAYQHKIGAVKTSKTKCKDKNCMDEADKQIKKFADKITALGK
jgi:hypothetical protein